MHIGTNLDQDLSADVVFFVFWKFIFVFMSTMQDKIVGKIDRDSIVLKLPTNYSHTYGILHRSNHFLTCKPMGVTMETDLFFLITMVIKNIKCFKHGYREFYRNSWSLWMQFRPIRWLDYLSEVYNKKLLQVRIFFQVWTSYKGTLYSDTPVWASFQMKTS